MNPVLLPLLGLLVLSSYRSDAATCTATTTTGNWENASTWSCGHVPTCNDAIVIPSGVTVTITSLLTYTSGCSSMSVSITGTLSFQTGKKLYLPSGSVITLSSGGLIDPGNGGGSSTLINIGGTTVWNADDGPLFGPRTLSDGVLPITLLSFQAEVCSQSICLTWSTASETDNAYFRIERAQSDFVFHRLDSVPGYGTSNRQRDYRSIDPQPPHELLYYRLIQTDYSGHSHQAGLVAIDRSTPPESVLQILPNPNTGHFQVRIYSKKTEEATLQIYQGDGRMCYSNSMKLQSHTETLLNLAQELALKPGLYTVALINTDHRVSVKMIVQ